jgi:hypothetical protein
MSTITLPHGFGTMIEFNGPERLERWVATDSNWHHWTIYDATNLGALTYAEMETRVLSGWTLDDESEPHGYHVVSQPPEATGEAILWDHVSHSSSQLRNELERTLSALDVVDALHRQYNPTSAD